MSPSDPVPADPQPLTVYCEQCGSPHPITEAGMVALEAGHEWLPVGAALRDCPSCRLLTCDRCWHEERQVCTACAPIVPVYADPPAGAPPGDGLPSTTATGPAAKPAARGRLALPKVAIPRVALPAGRPWSRRSNAPLLATAAVAVVAVAVALAIAANDGRDRGDRGGVAGAVATPRASAAPAPPSSALLMSPAAIGPGPASDGPSAVPSRSSPAPSATTASPRATSSASTVRATPHVDVTAAAVNAWVDDVGQVSAQVVVAVRNVGTVPVRFPGAESAYQVRAPDGRVVAGGLFARGFPPVVGPRQTAYFVDTVTALFVAPAEVASVDVDVRSGPAEDAPASLPVSDVTVTDGPAGPSVTGVVRNDRNERVGPVAVGVFLLDRNGAPLAGLYDLTDIPALEPNATAQFTTAYPAAPPVHAGTVSETVAVAFPVRAGG